MTACVEFVTANSMMVYVMFVPRQVPVQWNDDDLQGVKAHLFCVSVKAVVSVCKAAPGHVAS